MKFCSSADVPPPLTCAHTGDSKPPPNLKSEAPIAENKPKWQEALDEWMQRLDRMWEGKSQVMIPDNLDLPVAGASTMYDTCIYILDPHWNRFDLLCNG
jgi:hypothetical protein